MANGTFSNEDCVHTQQTMNFGVTIKFHEETRFLTELCNTEKIWIGDKNGINLGLKGLMYTRFGTTGIKKEF